jgi:hypothetical protein
MAAFSTASERRPVLDSTGFFKSIACIAMLVFEGDDELTPREKVGMFLSTIDSGNKFLNWQPPVLIGRQIEDVLWEVFLKYVSVKEKQKGEQHSSLTSMAYAKFVKESGLLRGMHFATGKTDTVFREVVMKRAHRVVKGLGGGSGGGGGGTHATNASKMSFDDFILSFAGLGRLKEPRALQCLDDSEIVKLVCSEIIR